MAPKRAIAYIKAFELPQSEEAALIECDVRQKTIVQASFDLHICADEVKRRKRKAYAKIADAINHGYAK